MRQTTRVRLTVACAALFLSAAAFAADDWDAFWKSVKVSPAPPRDFIEGRSLARVQNLTVGRISDETARTWVLADLRRGLGDTWASYNLRRDVADADVFGPPGLISTSAGIDQMRAKGIVRIIAPDLDWVAGGVMWVSPQVLKEHPEARLTEYVIVLAYRRPVGKGTTFYKDGRVEVATNPVASEVRYQIDSGRFYVHPTLGPLWYQTKGWTCLPNDGTVVGEICGRLKP